MTSSNSAGSRAENSDLAPYLARLTVSTALSPLLKTRAKRFLIALVASQQGRLRDYADAADMVLERYRKQCGFAAGQETVAIVTDQFCKTLKVCSGFERIVIIVHKDKVDAMLELACDHAIDIPEPSAKDVRSAVSALFKFAVDEDDAQFLASVHWSDLSLAFRDGRPLAVSISRLKNKAAGHGDDISIVPAASPLPRIENLSGYGEAAIWGLELAKDVDGWRSGQLQWRDVDRGVLLSGPPGVGKTVFASALALSCGVKLVQASLASWQDKGYLNDLLKDMRKSFEEAKKDAPAILFVDELDSIGNRETLRGESANYQHQVINAFLEQLDGATAREGVVVVGATNRPGDIDPAILRPGRLERVIAIPLPDPASRAAILQWHSGLKLTNTRRFVAETEGWTGADIEGLVRRARRSARELGKPLAMKFIEAALPQRLELPDETVRRIAVHECGHALVGIQLQIGQFKHIALSKSMVEGVA